MEQAQKSILLRQSGEGVLRWWQRKTGKDFSLDSLIRGSKEEEEEEEEEEED